MKESKLLYLNECALLLGKKKWLQKMVVEHITRHLLQGKILLQIEVSMPPDIMIRDAMALAAEAKEEILETLSDISQVGILLRLSQQNHVFSSQTRWAISKQQ
ncbi:hypothetical protein Ancab_019461 [Ancistrocladus abbreviatus]